MRTTIRIDDELYRRAKSRASASGRTVAEVIEDAVRDALAPRHVGPDQLVEFPTFGGSGVMPGVDLGSNVALRALLDQDRSLDALR